MAYHAFDFSERYNVPVLIRITTRLAHSRSGVFRSELQEMKELTLPDKLLQFILLPNMARKSYQALLDNQLPMEKESEMSPYNKYSHGSDRSLGIIACGIAYNYLIENFRDHQVPYPVLKISQYPVPTSLIRSLVEEVDEILVLEEGYPIVEEMLTGILDCGKPVKGRLNGILPRTGELNPDHVARALSMERADTREVPEIVKNRPPALCKGCSHADLFIALNEAMEVHGKGKVFSDIGCYTLGAYPPYESIYTCVDMGASVTMSKGAADAGLRPAVSVIGDSTFTHSGMTGLLDAVLENSPVTVIISDNSTTAMTGGQPSAATGKLEQICLGLGVEKAHLRVLRPHRKDHAGNVKILKEEIDYEGVSVVIARRECIQIATKKPH